MWPNPARRSDRTGALTGDGWRGRPTFAGVGEEENQQSRRERASRSVRTMLFPGQDTTLGKQLALRGGVAFACLMLTTFLVYVGREGYNDTQNPDGTLTFLDAFYFATVSLSTTGYGDIIPVSQIDRFISAFIITPLRVIFLIVLVGSTLEVLTRRTTAQYRENRWRKKVKDHTIIIGFGVKGRSAAQALIDNGTPPAQILVISPDESAVKDATDLGCIGIVGDGRRDDVLERACVETASRAIVATDSDDKAVLMTLNIRRLAPQVAVVAAVRESQHAPILRQSGANAVITTAEAAGRLMGISLMSPTAGELMEDLLDPSEGLEFCERPVTEDEIGSPVGLLANHGEMVLAIKRDDLVLRFDEIGDGTMQAGDVVVVIRHVLESPKRRLRR